MAVDFNDGGHGQASSGESGHRHLLASCLMRIAEVEDTLSDVRGSLHGMLDEDVRLFQRTPTSASGDAGGEAASYRDAKQRICCEVLPHLPHLTVSVGYDVLPRVGPGPSSLNAAKFEPFQAVSDNDAVLPRRTGTRSVPPSNWRTGATRLQTASLAQQYSDSDARSGARSGRSSTSYDGHRPPPEPQLREIVTVPSLQQHGRATATPSNAPQHGRAPAIQSKRSTSWDYLDSTRGRNIVDQVVVETLDHAERQARRDARGAPYGKDEASLSLGRQYSTDSSAGKGTAPISGPAKHYFKTEMKEQWRMGLSSGTEVIFVYAHKDFALVQCCGRIPSLILHPEAKFRLFWVLTGSLLIVYEAFAVPFHLSFNYTAEGLYLLFVNAVNSYFLLDIVASFITSYVEPGGSLVTSPTCIAVKYIQTWFVPDLIAGFPWDWVDTYIASSAVNDGLRLVRALRLLRLARMLRLVKLKKVLDRAETFIEGNQVAIFFVGILRVLFGLYGVTHWAACIWFVVGKEQRDNQNRPSWLDDLLMYGVTDTEPMKQYVFALYFTLTTMTTVGYGDITARNFSEVIFVLLLLCIASVVFAGLMGVLMDLVATLQSSSHMKQEKRAALGRYMRWRAVPRGLVSSIRQHMIFLWDTNEGYDAYEDDIKVQLPPVLRTELCFHVYGRVLQAAPFLCWMKDYNVCVKHLAQLVSSIFLVQGDHIFRMGQPNDQIYILISGKAFLSRNEAIVDETNRDGEDVRGRAHSNFASGFVIPRNKGQGIADVSRKVIMKARRINTIQAGKDKHEAILAGAGHLVARFQGPHSKPDRLQALVAQGERLERSLRLRCGLKNESQLFSPASTYDTTSDVGMAAQVDGAYLSKWTQPASEYGHEASSAFDIFDSEVLKVAELELARCDLRKRDAALFVQRAWRRRQQARTRKVRLSYQEGVTSPLSERATLGPVTPPTKKSVSRMRSKTMAAPAYFGESCLWVPYEEWNTQAPMPYMYAATAECRSEMLYIPRTAIQDVVDHFSPWLFERYDIFREAVVAGLEQMMGHGQPGQPRHFVDWAAADLSLPAQDEIGIDHGHRVHLSRATPNDFVTNAAALCTPHPRLSPAHLPAMPVPPRVAESRRAHRTPRSK